MARRDDDENLNEIWQLLTSRDFWVLTGIGLALLGILVGGIVMLINFDVGRMSCNTMGDLPAYLMFNTLIIFVFGGLVAMGEGFTYFDNKKRGFPVKKGWLMTFLGVALVIGVFGLVMLKIYC